MCRTLGIRYVASGLVAVAQRCGAILGQALPDLKGLSRRRCGPGRTQQRQCADARRGRVVLRNGEERLMTLRDVRGSGVLQRRPHGCRRTCRPLGREQDGGAVRYNQEYDKRMASDVHGDHLFKFLRNYVPAPPRHAVSVPIAAHSVRAISR